MMKACTPLPFFSATLSTACVTAPAALRIASKVRLLTHVSPPPSIATTPSLGWGACAQTLCAEKKQKHTQGERDGN